MVYRTDGTAVVVGNKAQQGLHWTQGRSANSGGDPSMSLNELTDLALSVPLVPVA